MSIYFSPSKNAFFPKEMQKDYELAGTWPNDLVEVDYSDFVQYSLNPPPQGMGRSFVNNEFTWTVLQESIEQQIGQERSWILSEISRVREELEKVQDSDPKAKGSASDWRNYRKALRVWSESSNFPDKDKRPLSPDMIKE